jgi:hypothetical protein
MANLIREIKKKEREKEIEKEKEIQERFNADNRDIIAFTIAAWQLVLPAVIALLITGLIVMWFLNLL